MEIQYITAADLQPWNRNPKKHDHAKIMDSIVRFGFTSPVLLDETTGRIIAGHGRVESLLKVQGSAKHLKVLKDAGLTVPKNVSVNAEGAWMVPVVRGLTFSSESEAEAYLITDNRLTEIGGWDDDMLLEMLRDIQSNVEDVPFSGTGYTDREVENLMRKADVARDAGPTAVEKADGFLNAGVKQIVMFFKAEEYDHVLERLDAAQKAHGIDNHTDLLLALLERDERRRATLTKLHGDVAASVEAHPAKSEDEDELELEDDDATTDAEA
jgi:hypothetical protein